MITTNNNTFYVTIPIKSCRECNEYTGVLENPITCEMISDIEITEVYDNCEGDYIAFEIIVSSYYEMRNEWTFYLYCDVLTTIYNENVRFKTNIICDE